MREVISQMLKDKGGDFIDKGWIGQRLEDISLKKHATESEL